MSTIEVMRKALEALENCTSEHGHRCSRCDSEVDPNGAAITALRAEIERLEAVEPVAESLEQKNARNARVQASYDALMQAGKHGHYETMFRVVREEVERARPAPIAPSIPAPTHEQIDEGWIQCGGSGSAYDAWHDGAHWAYTLAAARCGARIVKADTLQELADNAKQIGLEY